MSSFSTDLINLFRSMPGREFDPANKKWSFPLYTYEYILENVTDMVDINVMRKLTDLEIKKMDAIIIEESDDFFKLTVPYDQDVLSLLDNFDGEWNAGAQDWKFNNEVKTELINKH